ncbi:DMT family transporter [Pseudaestuariivita atlantica]|uniref:Membrane protein n=1 Tax=Pseudaestuariivita atlantica TaxID=1317121 RepID=A0A0L1JV02_9RHOB|nr:EamA family transporter [Pseudaestuariivita atlantica]KNG95512.1 membrane protein [Pseudaestuariivita atlantica]
MTTNPPQITATSWALVGVLSLTWGGAFLAMEMGLEGVPPFWLAASRILLGSLLMGAIIWARGKPLFTEPGARPWGRLFVIGLLSSALPFALLCWGQQYVTSGFAGVSMAAVALFVLPMAHLMIPGEGMTWRTSLGFVIGFAGVVFLIGAQAFDTTGAALEPAGRLACLAAAGCYALSSVMMRKLPPCDPVTLAGVLLAIGAVLAVPLAWAVEGPPSLPQGASLWWVIYLGLVPTAFANVLRVVLVRTAGPVFMSLVNYLVPVWSVLLGWIVLSEPLPSSLLLALILILAGMALSQGAALRRLLLRA